MPDGTAKTRMNDKAILAAQAAREAKKATPDYHVPCYGKGPYTKDNWLIPRETINEMVYTGHLDVENAPESGYCDIDTSKYPRIQVMPQQITLDERETTVVIAHKDSYAIIDTLIMSDFNRMIKAGYACAEIRIYRNGQICGGVFKTKASNLTFRTEN